MHISEGILSTRILIAGAVLASAGIAIGLRKIQAQKIMSVALFSSAFFVASLVHIKIGSISLHLVLSGIMGLTLGLTAFPAIFVALLLQAVLFQFGGLSVLGVNTFIIAAPAVIFAVPLRPLVNSSRQWIRNTASFLCGALPVLASAILASLTLKLSSPDFQFSAWAFFVTNLPLVIIEGVLTLVIIKFLNKVRPEVLKP